jgi:FtsP/CotA-like multicopper oxidase with cupredoxin domain
VYYIAADEVDWDYTPRGRGLIGLPHSEGPEDEEGGAGSKHRIYHKAIYREYTDASFRVVKPRPPEWQHLGILGPLIRAEVGDTIKIVFRNNTKLTLTMHPHGLQYAKDNEGAYYLDNTQGELKADDMVRPRGTYTYHWSVPERAGPGPGDGSSVLWMYHSHFLETKDINTGLIGPIIITGRGQSRPDGTPKDADREFVTAFAIFDETGSWFYEAPGAGKIGRALRLKASDPALREQHLLYTINGYTEGNLPLLTMKKGESVSWYLLSNSNEDDIHSAHWHGNTAISMHMRTDTISLLPMGMAVADMVPDAPGTWLFHCHINDHFEGGMVGLYQVLP